MIKVYDETFKQTQALNLRKNLFNCKNLSVHVPSKIYKIFLIVQKSNICTYIYFRMINSKTNAATCYLVENKITERINNAV